MSKHRKTSFVGIPNRGGAGFFVEGVDEDADDACCNPGGHSWVYTGTAYGGDDESYFGEGRCYCEFCGADGDA